MRVISAYAFEHRDSRIQLLQLLLRAAPFIAELL